MPDRDPLPARPSGPPYSRLHMAFNYALGMLGAVVVLVPYTLLCVFLLPWRHLRIRLGNRVGVFMGRFAYRVLGIEHELVGEDLHTQAPALFVCNHASSLDFWMAIQLCPSPGSGTVARKLLRVPVIGVAYWLSGHLMLDRSRRDRAIAAMEDIHALVDRHGMSLWILPEGTRSQTGRMARFKKGFAHIALATGLPVVPVVVHEAHVLWARDGTVRPGRFTVEVLPAVPTTGWTRDTLDDHIEGIERLFIEHLGQDQRPSPS